MFLVILQINQIEAACLISEKTNERVSVIRLDVF